MEVADAETVGTSKTKIVSGVVKAIWDTAKKGAIDNSKDFRDDVKELIELAKTKGKGKGGGGGAAKRGPGMMKRPKAKLSGGGIDRHINFSAGSALLTHFRDQWAAIHTSTEQSSAICEGLEGQLTTCHSSIARAHTVLENFSEQFHLLPSTAKAVENAVVQVKSLGEKLHEVEEAIMELAQAKVTLEMDRRKHSLRIQAEKRKEEQKSQLEHLEKVLCEERLLTVERQKQLNMEASHERQQAFQEIFDQQMSEYREKGEIELPIEKSGSSAASLEEVVIEDQEGTSSLNEFLNDVVMEDVIGSPKKSSDEGSVLGSHDAATPMSPDESRDQSPDAGGGVKEPHGDSGLGETGTTGVGGGGRGSAAAGSSGKEEGGGKDRSSNSVVDEEEEFLDAESS